MFFTTEAKVYLTIPTIILGFALFIYSVYLISENWYEIKGAYFYGADSFSLTEGIVESASIGQGQVSEGRDIPEEFYYPKISYSFIVNNRKYYSDKIAFANLRYQDFDKICRYLDRFQAGEKIMIYYIKSNPDISVLNVYSRDYFVGRIFGSLFFPIIIGIFFLRKYYKKKNKEADYLLKEKLNKMLR